MSSMDMQAELHRRLNELAEKVATLHWDLGGLTYEMAIRDHFRLDVLVRRAAELQEADAELGEVERLLAAASEGVGGASYCWRCGQPLLLEVPQSQPTVELPASAAPPPA